MRRECRERFPGHRGLAIPTCITARASRTCRDACRDRWLAVSFEVSSRHSRCMRNPQFCVSGKRPIHNGISYGNVFHITGCLWEEPTDQLVDAYHKHSIPGWTKMSWRSLTCDNVYPIKGIHGYVCFALSITVAPFSKHIILCITDICMNIPQRCFIGTGVMIWWP